jgi:hypothetical protein
MRLITTLSLASVLLLAGCGDGYRASDRTPAATVRATATPAVATAIAGSAVVPPATVITGDTTPTPETPAATATVAPPAATATPGPAGRTGIAGTVTIGPMCPVQRIDSPCPDRSYEATITIWQGGNKVAETRSGPDGRFVVDLPPGTYRVVGESPGTFPHATEQTVTVRAGGLTQIQIRYDSGIR